MAKKYEINVTQINEDGTREAFAFDKEDKHLEITCEGFAIIGILAENVGSCVSIHNMSTFDLALAVDGNEHLRTASTLASVLNKIGKEIEDAAD